MIVRGYCTLTRRQRALELGNYVINMLSQQTLIATWSKDIVMHSTDDKQAQASAPELDAQSVKDEAVPSQSTVNEQVSDAGNDEDQFYSILSKLKEAVDADRDTLEAALGKQGNAATADAADVNEAPVAKAGDKDVESNDAQAASSGDAKASDSEASSKHAHVSTGPLAAAAQADSESAEHSSEDMEKLKSKLKHLHRYHTAQQKAIREHIEEHFGKIYLQVEDVKDDGLRIDIDIIKADPEQGVENTILVTKGMGAYRMRLPEELLQYRNLDEVETETKASDVENAEAATRHYERCELYMELPASMDIESEKDEDSWPISMLNALARLPYIYNAWIGPGHIFTFNDYQAPGTKFQGAMLLPLAPHESVDEEAAKRALLCELPGDSGKVNFYRVVPLFEEELQYIEEHSAKTLMRCMDKSAFIADANRPLTKLRKVKPKVKNAADA